MTVSYGAMKTLRLFSVLQKLDIADKVETFDIYYIWYGKIEEYAEKFEL
jgi:hypothetical protein